MADTSENQEPNRIRSIERSGLRGQRPRRAPAQRRPSRSEDHTNGHATEEKKMNGGTRRPARPKKKGGKGRIIFVVIVVVLVLFAFLTTTFSSASININLATTDITVDDTFEAAREPSKNGDIAYSVRGPFTETRVATITKENLREETLHKRSSGTVTVYNTNPSGEPLDLVNRTRFEAPNGRLYRLLGAQKIPGGKKVGSNFEPGKKEVKVEADDAGLEYDIQEQGVRFSIPGLAKWKAFSDSYAVSETKIVGGFEGVKLIPLENVLKETRERLQKEIEVALKESLDQSLKENSLTRRVVFPNSVFITYQQIGEEQGEESVEIREEGTLRAASFVESELAALLSKVVPIGAGPVGVSPQTITKRDIDFAIISPKEFDIVTEKEFGFRLKGTATLDWDITDEKLFLSDIEGKNKADVTTHIIERYPEVKAIDSISLFPIWRPWLPGNGSKITIEKRWGSRTENKDSDK